MNQVKDKIVEILATMAGLPADQVKPETTVESLALDSLDLVELTLTLERDLDLEIDPDSLSELVTVQDAIDAVEATRTLAT